MIFKLILLTQRKKFGMMMMRLWVWAMMTSMRKMPHLQKFSSTHSTQTADFLEFHDEFNQHVQGIFRHGFSIITWMIHELLTYCYELIYRHIICIPYLCCTNLFIYDYPCTIWSLYFQDLG